MSSIGRRLSEVSHELRSASFLRLRLAVAVQRGNASCIIGTLQVNMMMREAGNKTKKWRQNVLSLLPGKIAT